MRLSCVTDGAGVFVEQTFSIIVTAINQPPTISATRGSNHACGEANGGNRVYDRRSRHRRKRPDCDGYVVKSALVPNANLVIGGSGANRTLTITPAAKATGAATITVTVSDARQERDNQLCALQLVSVLCLTSAFGYKVENPRCLWSREALYLAPTLPIISA